MVDKKDNYTYLTYRRNEKHLKIIGYIILAGGILFCIFLIWLLWHNPLNIIWAGIIFIVYKLTDFYLTTKWKDTLWRLNKNETTWGRGAGAEIMVSGDLEQLPSGYKIINDFPTDRGNIDNIIVGSAGIFVLEIKSHKGTIGVIHDELNINGKFPEKDYIIQTFKEAMYIHDLINTVLRRDYYVTGILEFPEGEIDTTSIKGKIHYIWIGGRKFHEYLIETSRQNLSDIEIEEVYRCLSIEKNNYIQNNKISSLV